MLPRLLLTIVVSVVAVFILCVLCFAGCRFYYYTKKRLSKMVQSSSEDLEKPEHSSECASNCGEQESHYSEHLEPVTGIHSAARVNQVMARHSFNARRSHRARPSSLERRCAQQEQQRNESSTNQMMYIRNSIDIRGDKDGQCPDILESPNDSMEHALDDITHGNSEKVEYPSISTVEGESLKLSSLNKNEEDSGRLSFRNPFNVFGYSLFNSNASQEYTSVQEVSGEDASSVMSVSTMGDSSPVTNLQQNGVTNASRNAYNYENSTPIENDTFPPQNGFPLHKISQSHRKPSSFRRPSASQSVSSPVVSHVPGEIHSPQGSRPSSVSPQPSVPSSQLTSSSGLSAGAANSTFESQENDQSSTQALQERQGTPYVSSTLSTYTEINEEHESKDA